MVCAGLDIGTSGCKMLVYDLDGQVLFKSAAKYRELGEKGHRELDPDTVLFQIKHVLKDVGEHCEQRIDAMAITCLGESVVCIDRNGKVLANSMLTGDSRGISETTEIIRKYSARRIMEITGLPPNELYGLPKYTWLNRNTDAIENAYAIMFYEDYTGFILTGERKVSYTSAARSMAFDIRKKEWSKELLDFAGIQVEQMSIPVAPCTVIGKIKPEIAKELHLNPDMKIVAGGHDQSCAALGSGLYRPEDAECGMGTCEFSFFMLPEPIMSQYMIDNDFTCIPYILPDTYLSSIEVTTCGILKNWARDTILKSEWTECEAAGRNFYELMDEKIRGMKTDVIVLPQFGSSGNPNLSMNAVGTITGLNIHTESSEIYRGILEGMAFQEKLAYDRLQKLGIKAESLVCTGGGASSELTLQMRADITEMNVKVPESEESGSLGCMLMAATALGGYSSLEEGIKRAIKYKKEYRLDPVMQQYYIGKFEQYKTLYGKMYDFGQ